MPVLDGAEMTRRLKTKYPDLPVVLITGSVIVPEAELEGAGFDAVIHKPFELRTIARAIDRLFPL
jgi:CheY-like chemotaxis protein